MGNNTKSFDHVDLEVLSTIQKASPLNTIGHVGLMKFLAISTLTAVCVYWNEKTFVYVLMRWDTAQGTLHCRQALDCWFTLTSPKNRM